MEERMADGLSGEEAYAKFKAENSWLKLRKLQYKHWEQSADTVQHMLKAQLLNLFVGPLSLLTCPMVALLWWCSGLEIVLWKPYLIALHVLLGGAMRSTIIYIFVARLVKRRYFATIFQLALWSICMLIYLPAVTNDFFNFGFTQDGDQWMRVIFTGLYAAIGINYSFSAKLSFGR
jgi:hypothetical protein